MFSNILKINVFLDLTVQIRNSSLKQGSFRKSVIYINYMHRDFVSVLQKHIASVHESRTPLKCKKEMMGDLFATSTFK